MIHDKHRLSGKKTMSERTEAVAILCRLLTAGDDADRCHAARALGRLQDSAALPALVATLRHEDPDVCSDAAEALGEIGDPRAFAPLLELLQHHPEGDVRTIALEAIARLPDPRVPTVLLPLVLQRPENLAWDGEWDDWWDMQLRAVEALGRLKVVDAVPVLEKLLKREEGEGIEAELLSSLARIGGNGLRTLGHYLLKGSPPQRRRAAIALRHTGDEDGLALLAQALLDEEGMVRCAAIQSLTAAGAARYLGVILVSLNDPDTEVRKAAVASCARLAHRAPNPEVIVARIVSLLDDPDPVVRATTLTTLTTLGERQPLPPELAERALVLLNDPELQVAAAACDMILLNRDRRAQADLARIAIGRGNVYLRQRAISTLGTIADDETILESLARLVMDPEPLIRLEALRALAGQADAGGPRAGKALEIVIDTLLAREETPSVPSEKEAMEDGTSGAPRQATPSTSTLKAIGQQADYARDMPVDATPTPPEPDLPSALREYWILAQKNEPAAHCRKPEQRAETRVLAARVLGYSTREEAIAALVECLQSDLSALRRESALALARIAEKVPSSTLLNKSYRALAAHLAEEDETVRQACARALGKLGNTEALAPLLAATRDPSAQVRIEAIHSIKELLAPPSTDTLPTPHITETLLALLKDRASGVRLAAAAALTALPFPTGQSWDSIITAALIEAAFRDNGGQARQLGELLRQGCHPTLVSTLLEQLETAEISLQKQILIQLLVQVLKPDA